MNIISCVVLGIIGLSIFTIIIAIIQSCKSRYAKCDHCGECCNEKLHLPIDQLYDLYWQQGTIFIDDSNNNANGNITTWFD